MTQQMKTALTALGTHSRHAVHRVVWGSVAETAVPPAGMPVLVANETSHAASTQACPASQPAVAR